MNDVAIFHSRTVPRAADMNALRDAIHAARNVRLGAGLAGGGAPGASFIALDPEADIAGEFITAYLEFTKSAPMYGIVRLRAGVDLGDGAEPVAVVDRPPAAGFCELAVLSRGGMDYEDLLPVQVRGQCEVLYDSATLPAGHALIEDDRLSSIPCSYYGGWHPGGVLRVIRQTVVPDGDGIGRALVRFTRRSLDYLHIVSSAGDFHVQMSDLTFGDDYTLTETQYGVALVETAAP